jgi:hypothetical protein
MTLDQVRFAIEQMEEEMRRWRAQGDAEDATAHLYKWMDRLEELSYEMLTKPL